MPPRPLYQPKETRKLSDALQFETKASNDIWALKTGVQWDDDIASLSSILDQPDPLQQQQQGQDGAPTPFEMPAPLPVIVSERPDAGRIAQQQQQQAPPAASGTPSAMPTAPRTVDATITAGPRPGQSLQPGESVGSVTLGDGPSASQRGPVPAGTGDIDNSSRESFVRTAYPYMLEAAGGDHNLAELMLAKAISENGDVGKGGGFIGNNFSGIKGVGSAGSFEADTWEDYGQGRVNIRDKFAAYNTPQEGFRAFMGFLHENSRYAPALQRYQQTGDADQLFRDIHAAGYATDPIWTDKVQNIRQHQVAPVVRNRQTADARQSLNAGAGSPQPAPAAPPQAAPGDVPPATGGGSETAMWSPDDMPVQGGAFQAATGRSGGSGVLYRGPLGAAPQEIGNEQGGSSYNDPDAGGTITTPLPPQEPSYNDPTTTGTQTAPLPAYAPTTPDNSPVYTIADGRTEPPTPQGDWQPVETVPAPVMHGPSLDEAGPEMLTPPGSPYAAGQAESMEPAPNRFDERPGYGQVVASSGEPDYVDSRPQTVTQAIGQGIRSAQGPGGILEPAAGLPRIMGRLSEIQRQAAAELGRNPMDQRVLDDAGWRARNPQLAAEVDDLRRQGELSMLGNLDAPRRVAQGAAQIAAPVVRGAAEAVAPIVDDAAAAGRAALQAGADAPVPQMLGSGFIPNAADEMRTSVRAGAGDIEQRAVQQFGTTENIGSMGYVLRDGTGLDFSGGGGGRGMDHRSITSVIDGPTGTPGMQQFMGDTGAVRVSMNSGGQLSLDIPNGLSPQQRRLLMDEARYAESVYLDIMDPTTGERISSQQFSLPMDRGKLNQTIRQIPDHMVEPSEAARAAETAAKVESVEILRSRIQFARDTLAGKFGPVDETARAYYAQSFKADQAKLRAIESGKSAGSGFIRSMSDLRNAAQGGVIGAASELTSDEDLTPQERLARIAAGAALGVGAGRRAGRQAGRQLGSGFVPETLADAGPVPRSRMNMDDVAQRAQNVLGVAPEQVRAWQAETLAEPAYGRAVRGAALQQAARVDESAAMQAIERLEAAQARAASAGDPLTDLSAADKLDVADAALEAAETALAMRGSQAASTAEGRATARALAQRRQSIVARTAATTAERARQVGKDAEAAAAAVVRAAATGQVSPEASRALRTLVGKLDDAAANGLAGDGAGGRLDALEQAATAAKEALAAPAAPARPSMRSQASRYETPMSERIAREISGQLVPGMVGAGIGAQMDEEDPQRGAARGLAAGAALGFTGRRIGDRFPTKAGGIYGLLGPMPTPEMPNRSLAIGPDSKQYTFAYRVVDLDDLVTSNTPTGTVNPAYPAELQPRDRTRAASQVQVDRIVQQFNPVDMLHDGGRLDSGPMIIGQDRAVESGNGRTMALRRLAQERPEEYARYVEMMRSNLAEYGLDEKALAGKSNPVLVRERLTDVDRPAFAATANGRVSAGMSPVEQARQAAASLSDEVVSNLTIGEGDTIATALRRADNQDVVRAWVNAMPENDLANILDENGEISTQGYQQLADTLLVRTYGEGAGVRAFIEAADPEVRNVQNAVMASLPDMARAEALIRSGQRDAGLSLAGDVAAATEVLSRLKRDRMSVGDYVRQIAMGDRELTPFQEQLLQFLDQNQRRPAAIREALREYAAAVENAADPNQMDMFGGAVASVTKEDAWNGATSGIRRERDARIAQQRAKLQAENAARTPAGDIIPATGGPEGVLEVQGAPQPTPRPGPTGGAGDPVTDARLRAAGGQVPLEPTPRPGPTGGAGEAVTDARLPINGQVPLEPTPRPGAVDSAPAGGPEAALTLGSGRSITEVSAQIKDVLANPNAPDAVQRLRALHGDLQEISAAGYSRSSDIRRRLQRNGLLRAGLASKTEDVDGLVKALARVNADKPEEMQAVLKIISKPRLIDKVLEYQYVNMLSSPITQAVNISSNALQIAGRLLLQNPLEFAFTGGQSSGVGAAFQGTVQGAREAWPEMKQIMRTGVSSKSLERASELGDYAHIRREALTEQFGKTGALMHIISTRPLAAMDALFGHMAYAGAAEQYAQRTADRLLKAGDGSVKGMSRVEARQHIMANIWDYPEIIEKAGDISDYTLLKSNDSKGTGYGNRAERALRNFVALGRAEADDSPWGQASAFFFNQILPFFNVPLNAAKQGVERSAGAIYNPIRAGGALRETRAAEKAGDTAAAYAHRERFGELAAKSVIAGGALTVGTVLALGDNLTDDGPSDPGDRAVWEQTHKRNSWRVPGTETWYSWEGTPMAVPFGMVAGAREGWKESREASAKKGETNTGDAIAAAGIKGVQGAFSGFASQSFVRALGQQYQLMTGDQTGLGTIAASATGTVSRFMPSSGMLNFLARVTDTMERDAGKPRVASDLPENVGARLATRIPGLRQQVDPKLTMYGEPAANEQFGAAGLMNAVPVPPLPSYRGRAPMAGDAITREVEKAGVGAPSVPDEITIPRMDGMKIPLKTPRERMIFQKTYGQAYRENLQAAEAGRGDLDPKAIENLRSLAREAAVAAVLSAIGPDEIERRLTVGVR